MRGQATGLRVKRIKSFSIERTTVAAIVGTWNKITSGQAVTTAGDGTDRNLAANFIENVTLVDIQYIAPDNTHYTLLVFYTD